MGSNLAEGGIDVMGIKAVLGHRSVSQVQRYTQQADQRRLAKDAIAKLRRRRR